MAAVLVLTASAACLQATPGMEVERGSDPRSDDLDRGGALRGGDVADDAFDDAFDDAAAALGLLAAEDEAGLGAAEPMSCRGRYCHSAADVLAMLPTVSVRAQCVIRIEIGGVGYDPNVYGAAREEGPGQLHPRGKLPLFLSESGGDQWSPYDVLPWVDGQIGKGQGRAWAGIRDGWC